MTVSYPISSPAHGETVDDTDLAAFADASNDLNTRLLVVESAQTGTTTVLVASGSTNGSASVTFSPAFSATPTVQITLMEAAGGLFVPILTAMSSTGFTVKVSATAAVGVNHTITVIWTATP